MTWVPFSTRYGIDTDGRFADHEGHDRHTPDAPTAPNHVRCDCLGTSRLRCAAYADAEDLICAECRAWCYGSTPDGVRVALPRRNTASQPSTDAAQEGSHGNV